MGLIRSEVCLLSSIVALLFGSGNLNFTVKLSAKITTSNQIDSRVDGHGATAKNQPSFICVASCVEAKPNFAASTWNINNNLSIAREEPMICKHVSRKMKRGAVRMLRDAIHVETFDKNWDFSHVHATDKDPDGQLWIGSGVMKHLSWPKIICGSTRKESTKLLLIFFLDHLATVVSSTRRQSPLVFIEINCDIFQ